MLEFNHISKTFDSDLFKKKFVALKDVSFEIKENKITGYLGANGAGKTTSLKIAMGFIPESSGEIIFSPKLGSTRERIFENIGFLPERPFFYPHITGREFCFYMGKLANCKRGEIVDMINLWAPRLSIDFALDRGIKKYSKGMLQRLGFLVTMIHKPKLIILDEPLSGLDPIGRKELKDIILEINKNSGTSVFFSSHIVSDIEEVCDNVVFLKDGKIAFDGKVDEIITKNIKENVTISYEEFGQIIVKKINKEDKNQFITKILGENKNIISLEHDKPTLEEIFYNVK